MKVERFCPPTALLLLGLGLILTVIVICVVSTGEYYPGRNLSPIITSTPTIPPLARVQVGDVREEAMAVLSPDAWYHADCTDENGYGYDIFFYGAQDTSATVIVMGSAPMDDRVIVGSIYQLVENYWVNLYRDCIPEEIIQTQLH